MDGPDSSYSLLAIHICSSESDQVSPQEHQIKSNQMSRIRQRQHRKAADGAVASGSGNRQRTNFTCWKVDSDAKMEPPAGIGLAFSSRRPDAADPTSSCAHM